MNGIVTNSPTDWVTRHYWRPQLNRELGNTAYSGKREVYQQSEFAITRRVAEEFEAWTVEKIRAHQQWMARQATDIWRIPFLAVSLSQIEGAQVRIGLDLGVGEGQADPVALGVDFRQVAVVGRFRLR